MKCLISSFLTWSRSNWALTEPLVSILIPSNIHYNKLAQNKPQAFAIFVFFLFFFLLWYLKYSRSAKS